MSEAPYMSYEFLFSYVYSKISNKYRRKRFEFFFIVEVFKKAKKVNQIWIDDVVGKTFVN